MPPEPNESDSAVQTAGPSVDEPIGASADASTTQHELAAGATTLDDAASALDGGVVAADAPTVMFDGTPIADETEAAPAWVKDLRKKFREQQHELAQLRRGGAAADQTAIPPAPGTKPQIKDFDFDADAYSAALDKWYEASRKHDSAVARARDQQAQDERAWTERVAAYQEAGRKLGFADYEECEAAATTELSVTQQGLIVQGADNPALVMYALGRNVAKCRELAAITDPVKFAVAMTKFEGKLTMTTSRKPTTKPESRAPASGTSSASALQGTDKRREELRAEAARTGDMSKLLAFNRQQRATEQKRA